jgi:glucosamine--fructose-6-phosphate aminotransferase (isomerizing)
MCGIVGYVGSRKASEVLVKGLQRLEYRGYDSAGIAVFNSKGSIALKKKKGKVKELMSLLEREPISGNIGISHTRWSTHGIPNDVNAHPHLDCKGKIAIVHNGIIENFQELKDALIMEGHRFLSDTDTETIAHLIGQPARYRHRRERELLGERHTGDPRIHKEDRLCGER